MGHLKPAQPKIVVLRWGHRAQRDVRLTSHVALAARAFGASGFVLSDVVDQNLEKTVEKVVQAWGGSFRFEMGMPWEKTVSEWKSKGGIVVHLTIYGESVQISNVLKRVRDTNKDVLLLIGSQKVPPEFFSSGISDFNVSIGNQPHSECAAVAVFLDRFFDGKELESNFENARLRVIPQERGKKIKSNMNSS